MLYAYDATNLATLLYDSNQAEGNRDVPGQAVKFAVPIVANGKVYVGSQYSVSAYGLLGAGKAASVPTFTPAPGSYAPGQTVTLSDSTSGAVIHYTTNGTTPTSGSPVYGGTITLQSTTTIEALATASGLATSGVAGGTYTIASSSGKKPVSVALSTEANVDAVANTGSAPLHGGIDGSGNAYAEALLGTSQTWSGATFALAGPGATGAVSGKTIALPAGSDSSILLLATAVNGNQVNQKFVVTYTDGSTTTFTQSLSDWFTPQNYAGESQVLAMPYRITAGGAADDRTFYLYGYSFALNAAKTVASIALPKNANVVVLGIDVVPTAAGSGGGGSSGGSSSGGSSSGSSSSGSSSSGSSSSGSSSGGSSPTSVSLAGAANVDAIAKLGTAVPGGGLDGSGDAFGAAAIGTALTWSGSSFVFGAADAADAASNTTIPLPAGNFSQVKLLATGIHGSQTAQTFTVAYTDGTTTTITQSVSDWFTPANFAGESLVLAMPYRVLPAGTEDARTFNLYGYDFAINAAKTVKSIRLPGNRNVVVLAVTLTP